MKLWHYFLYYVEAILTYSVTPSSFEGQWFIALNHVAVITMSPLRWDEIWLAIPSERSEKPCSTSGFVVSAGAFISLGKYTENECDLANLESWYQDVIYASYFFETGLILCAMVRVLRVNSLLNVIISLLFWHRGRSRKWHRRLLDYWYV